MLGSGSSSKNKMLDLSDDQPKVGAFEDLRRPLEHIEEETEVGG